MVKVLYFATTLSRYHICSLSRHIDTLITQELYLSQYIHHVIAVLGNLVTFSLVTGSTTEHDIIIILINVY